MRAFMQQMVNTKEENKTTIASQKENRRKYCARRQTIAAYLSLYGSRACANCSLFTATTQRRAHTLCVVNFLFRYLTVCWLRCSSPSADAAKQTERSTRCLRLVPSPQNECANPEISAKIMKLFIVCARECFVFEFYYYETIYAIITVGHIFYYSLHSSRLPTITTAAATTPT